MVIYGRVVSGGDRFCMSPEEERTTVSHFRLIGLGEVLPGGIYGLWMVIPTLDTCLLDSELCFLVLGSSRAPKSPGFHSFPSDIYTLGRWDTIFQVLEEEAIKTSMLYPEGVIREYLKSIK